MQNQVAICRRVAKILHWEEAAEAPRVHFFLQTFDDLFSSRRQNLSSHAAGSIFLTYLRPTEHFWYENSVTLLNKAGPTSQQSQFFL